MIVTATYGDGTSRNVTNYSIENGDKLTAEQTKVIISYTEKGITKTTEQKIKVEHNYKVELVKEPTCTEQGYTIYICTACSTRYKGNVKEALGHNFIDGICTRCGEKKPDISVESEEYHVDEGSNIISRITPNTTVGELIENIITNATEIKVFKDEIELGEEDIIGTDVKIVLRNEDAEAEYRVSIIGDLDGDGDADFLDMIEINKYRLGFTTLSRIQELAGDVDKNGKINFFDMIEINKFRLGLTNQL
ncbi:MAG: hypothetical protein IJK61_04835, partial [Bacteroidetes bacterium]|nr:hypothetical protein [Bacteroidota bacterium]